MGERLYRTSVPQPLSTYPPGGPQYLPRSTGLYRRGRPGEPHAPPPSPTLRRPPLPALAGPSPPRPLGGMGMASARGGAAELQPRAHALAAAAPHLPARRPPRHTCPAARPTALQDRRRSGLAASCSYSARGVPGAAQRREKYLTAFLLL